MLRANLVFLWAVLAPAVLAQATLGRAQAADASPWDGGPRTAMRLIAGTAHDEAGTINHRAGIEIRLAPGWKTYWRYPGDSGIPPRFDFTGSRNVKAVTVRWPAPQRLADENGTSIGYKHDVIFPLDIVPQDAGKPIVLRIKIDYAVCEKLCVPADGTGELAITGVASENAARIAQADALVPKTAALGAQDTLAIKAVRREGGNARVIVDVAAPAGVDLALFAEGPTAEWALPVPAPIDGAPKGLQRFAFDLAGLPPGATADGATLKLTAVAGERAIEAAFRLD